MHSGVEAPSWGSAGLSRRFRPEYELDVKIFQDNNGDGIGDFAGSDMICG